MVKSTRLHKRVPTLESSGTSDSESWDPNAPGSSTEEIPVEGLEAVLLPPVPPPEFPPQSEPEREIDELTQILQEMLIDGPSACCTAAVLMQPGTGAIFANAPADSELAWDLFRRGPHAETVVNEDMQHERVVINEEESILSLLRGELHPHGCWIGGKRFVPLRKTVRKINGVSFTVFTVRRSKTGVVLVQVPTVVIAAYFDEANGWSEEKTEIGVMRFAQHTSVNVKTNQHNVN